MMRFVMKLLLAGLLLGGGVFYGLDMAKRGIEQMNGPLQPLSPQEIETVQPHKPLDFALLPDAPEPAIANEELAAPMDHTPLPPFEPIEADQAIHRLADKTGELIQITLQGGVELIVSVFETIIH